MRPVPCHHFFQKDRTCTWRDCKFNHSIFPRDFDIEDVKKIDNWVRDSQDISYTVEAERAVRIKLRRDDNNITRNNAGVSN